MKNVLIRLLMSVVCLVPLMVQAQNPAVTAAAQAEIRKRGLDEAELTQRLAAKGINVNTLTPEQLPALQGQIEAIVAEMEAEKRGEIQNVAATATKEVATEAQDLVEEGASVEEALSEAVVEAIQEDIPLSSIYGHNLFKDKSLSVFRVGNDVIPPDSYILSTGDVVTITIFGASQADLQFEINKEGYISPPQMPKIFLKGIPLGKAKDLLQSRFSQYYVFRPGQFAVALTTARTITVSIFGEAVQNGSFTMSAINTGFNALVAAGGPTEIGSVRNIKVYKNGKPKTMDVYAFLDNPAIQFDFFLDNNDVIQIPVATRIVGISGAVRRAGRFELLEKEQLTSLLKYAGGFADNAYRENIQVRRYVDDKQILIDIPWKSLQENKQDFNVLPGDEIVIKNIPTKVEQFVNIDGAVNLKGEYALREGMKISDLLKNGEIRQEAKLDAAFLIRTNDDATKKMVKLDIESILANVNAPENLLLLPKDAIYIYAQKQYVDMGDISIGGAVRQPKKFSLDPNNGLRLDEAILFSGGLKQTADDIAYIIRTDVTNPKNKEYIRVNVREALRNPNGEDNLTLTPLDEVKVLSKPVFSDEFTVRVGGSVRAPGEFKFDESLTIKDALLLAGGLTYTAATNKVDLFRVKLNGNEPTTILAASLTVDEEYNVISGMDSDFKFMPFDQIVVRNIPDFELQEMIEIKGQVRYPGAYALLGDNETIASVIERAGGLTAEAFTIGAKFYRSEGDYGAVVLRLDEIIRNPKSSQNMVMRKGDVLEIPKRQDLVSINTQGTMAAELYPADYLTQPEINVAYDGPKSAKWYVDQYAVGFAPKAKRRSVAVEYPNGEKKRTLSFLGIKKYPLVKPGSTINIAMKQPKKKEKDEPKKKFDWNETFTKILSFASVTATMILAYSALR